jgi:hypothetical protein
VVSLTDKSRGVIYDGNMLTVQATVVSLTFLFKPN